MRGCGERVCGICMGVVGRVCEGVWGQLRRCGGQALVLQGLERHLLSWSDKSTWLQVTRDANESPLSGGKRVIQG